MFEKMITWKKAQVEKGTSIKKAQGNGKRHRYNKGTCGKRHKFKEGTH